jgi:hypothetical protein
MKKNFRLLARIWVVLPFVCVSFVTGQKSGDAFLRAASTPWPDSTVTYTAAGEKQNKTVYTYDASGNQTLYESFYREGNQWVNTYKGASAYDAAGRLTLRESYRWDNNRWTGMGKHTYAYDNRGVDTLSVEYHGSNNQWVKGVEYHNDVKTANAGVYVVTARYYRPDGSITRGIFVSDPYGTIEHVNASDETLKTEYQATYDVNDNLIQVETSSLRGDETRVPEMKYVIQYENNRPLSLEEYVLEDNHLFRRGSYAYDAKGNITLYEVHKWDYDKKQMLGVKKQVNTYDAGGRLLSSEFYTEDAASGSWAGTYKNAYTYDADGNRLSQIYYEGKDALSGHWLESFKYTYEKRNERGDVVLENYHVWENNGWVRKMYTVSYPNGDILAAAERIAPATQVWTENGTLHVRTALPSAPLRIHALSGELLRQLTLSAGETRLALPPGIYVVQAGDSVAKVLVGK